MPTKRWGSALYHQAGNATGSVRGLSGMYYKDGTTELLAFTDDGYLTKKSGASYAIITGVSWASGPSGMQAYMAQLDNSMYIVNGRRELVRYSTPTLVGFPTIATPVIQGASNISNATGTTTYGFRVSAVSQVGETVASQTFELKNQPDVLGGLAGGTIRLQWTGVSTASGILQGFNIYGRKTGDERFIAGVDAATTTWLDDNKSVPKELTFPQTANTTGGPIAKTVIRYQDRLVYAGLDNEPSKILISGHAPFHERFDWSYGGTGVEIEPDAGDDIVQLVGFADRIVTLKERSIWQVTLSGEQVGNFFVAIPTVKLITGAHGCIAPGSVVAVNNDIYFLSRNGVRTLGFQQNYFDTLRTNELSIKIRPYFEGLTVRQKKDAIGVFYNNKYLLAFPGKGEMIVFDTERGAWTGPWSLDATVFEVFIDSADEEKLLFAKNESAMVDEMSGSYTDDKGTAIATSLKTRSEDFGDWTRFKNIKDVFTQMRNVRGSVNVDIKLEGRTGSTTSAKNFTISTTAGNSGWGADMFGNTMFGDSEESAGGAEADFLIKWANLNKTARLMSITISSTAKEASYELLSIRAKAKILSQGFNPSSWRV